MSKCIRLDGLMMRYEIKKEGERAKAWLKEERRCLSTDREGEP